MMRSLFSGISGLKVHQTKMDVIGNNISNVNTVGFRASSVNFTDVFYQTTQGASGPNAATGAAGTNAIQIGLGSNVAAIAVDLSGTGATQRTDRGMDVMINGDAFLIVKSNGNTYFTKSGALDLDANGTLYCTTNGASVLGWQVDDNGEIRKDTVSELQLKSPENESADPEATTGVTLSGNVDKKDPQVQFSSTTGYPISVSFYDNTGELYTAKLQLKLASEDDDSTYNVSITDILGSDGKSALKTEKDDGKGNITYAATDMASKIKLGGQSLTVAVDQATGDVSITGTFPQLKFNSGTGSFVSVGDGTGVPQKNGQADTDRLNLTIDETNFPAKGVNINFSGLTMYAGGGSCTVKPSRGDSDNDEAAGNMAGTLNGFSVQTDGKIYGTYSNGDSKLLGQIAVATFANPSGLEAAGNSLYSATMNSGDFDGIGSDISEVGKLSIGALEMSDVDLATEFTNMITTQRGFQANSRIITTSDTMLEELVNLKR